MSDEQPAVKGAERRTSLAGERTLLAWWRTALTAIAVSLGVGRLLPELAPDNSSWPFALLGVGFALYGIAMFVYGSRRMGVPGGRGEGALALFTTAGILLGLATIAVILAQ